MKKLRILLLLIVLVPFSCEVNKSYQVTYLVTDCSSGFDIWYRNENTDLIHERVIPVSEEDEWKYNFVAEEGGIVFISAIYDDINSSLKAKILIDNKVYKEAFSKHDTANFVIVSGTVPYHDE
jgi:hypothetical protein